VSDFFPEKELINYIKKNITSMKINDKWLTKFELSNQSESPDYNETIKYFQRIVDSTSYAKMFTMGVSPQGREIKYLVLTKDKEFTPAKANKSKKAIILIQNGIHPGEIAGKDASMILLREILITKEKVHLLDNLILLVIPIFNVDGHERLSSFNRVNQVGPVQMGWRTNSLNLNLNRDYTKADTPEMKAWLKFYNDWRPDFMIDNHATNGADYQYHVTYQIGKHENVSHHLSSWAREKFYPNLIFGVERDGFLTAPYFEYKNDENIMDGFYEQPSLPRFSHG
jgi:murein tripeptide amidase MpaA